MTVTDRDVMLLHDGELAPEGERRLATARRDDPSVDARLAGLQQVAAFARAWARTRDVRAPARPRRRSQWASPFRLAVGGVALAAAALFLVPRVGAGPTEPVVESRGAGLPAAAVAVEQVDFGAHAGTIFSVSAAGTETTVVWLSDDTDENSLAL